MQGEGVPPDRIAALDVADHSRHWERSRTFLQALAPWFAAEAPDAEARQRMAVERLAARWAEAPPDHPMLVAGSTGSRGATQAFLQAVARLPQGAVILPGFDFDTPADVWQGMTDATTAEDHPQFRFARLMQALDLDPGDVALWDSAAAPCPDRNRLISLALRPAPVTDRWMVEGPQLTGIQTATADMTLIEAPSPRAEALAIALILRHAAQDGKTAALITPDRMLTRQVTAALDRWGILPDDSAGRPLALSPPGRFLRQIARLFGQRLTAERLIALLKHPLTHSGADRGPHLRLTRELELHIRRHGPAFPQPANLIAWAEAHPKIEATVWAAWLGSALDGLAEIGTRPLAEHLAHHLQLAQTLAAGPNAEGTGELWLEEAGEAAQATVAALMAEAGHGGTILRSTTPIFSLP
jgi:ATP-dependent helicase/nuclease subunit B